MATGYAKSKILADTEDGSKLEMVDDQSLEMPAAGEFNKVMEEEAFMAEPVTILMADTTDENAPTHAIFSVNGVTQPIFRNVPTTVKRKYVEAMARCKETKYKQRSNNPNEPDKIEMLAHTALTYPFQVVEDKNPKGRAWLAAVLAEPA